MTTEQIQHEQNATGPQQPERRGLRAVALLAMLILAVGIAVGIRSGIAGRVAAAWNLFADQLRF